MNVKLNVAVAVHMFGAKWEDVHDPDHIVTYLVLPGGERVAHRYGDGMVSRFGDYVDFSGNMTDAWLVVEEILQRAGDWSFELEVFKRRSDTHLQHVANFFITRADSHCAIDVEGPAAICRAALAAVGHPFEEEPTTQG